MPKNFMGSPAHCHASSPFSPFGGARTDVPIRRISHSAPAFVAFTAIAPCIQWDPMVRTQSGCAIHVLPDSAVRAHLDFDHPTR